MNYLWVFNARPVNVCWCRLRSFKCDRDSDFGLLLLLILHFVGSLALSLARSIFLMFALLICCFVCCSAVSKKKERKKPCGFSRTEATHIHNRYGWKRGGKKRQQSLESISLFAAIAVCVFKEWISMKMYSFFFDYCLFIHSSITICVIIYWQSYIKEMKTMNRFHQARCKCTNLN